MDILTIERTPTAADGRECSVPCEEKSSVCIAIGSTCDCGNCQRQAAPAPVVVVGGIQDMTMKEFARRYPEYFIGSEWEVSDPVLMTFSLGCMELQIPATGTYKDWFAKASSVMEIVHQYLPDLNYFYGVFAEAMAAGRKHEAALESFRDKAEALSLVLAPFEGVHIKPTI